MTTIQHLLVVSYQFREQMKALLRPYDFADLLRACNLKPREHEKSAYLTPMNELFRMKDLYKTIDEHDVRIVVVSKDLRYMEIQLGISNKNWNSVIRTLPVSVMILVLYQTLFTDDSMNKIASCVRRDSGIEMEFVVISCSNRMMHSNHLCVTNIDLVSCEQASYNGTGIVNLRACEPSRPEYDQFDLSDFCEGHLKRRITKYCNAYSDVLETCYIASSGMEPCVGSAYSKTVSIPTDCTALARWNTIVLVMDYVDLSELCNEMLSTGIVIPFTFNSF